MVMQEITFIAFNSYMRHILVHIIFCFTFLLLYFVIWLYVYVPHIINWKEYWWECLCVCVLFIYMIPFHTVIFIFLQHFCFWSAVTRRKFTLLVVLISFLTLIYCQDLDLKINLSNVNDQYSASHGNRSIYVSSPYMDWNCVHILMSISGNM